MKRGCTIGNLSRGSKIAIGVAVVAAAAIGGYVIYKRSQQSELSPTIQPSAVPQGGPKAVWSPIAKPDLVMGMTPEQLAAWVKSHSGQGQGGNMLDTLGY
jgi:hypothetical protein